MSFKRITFPLFFVLALIMYTLPVLAIGVQPMVLDFWGKPGEKYSFEIYITPEERQRIVHLSLYQPFQSLDGSLDFVEGDPAVYPPIGWVDLEQERIVVPPGVSVPVQGTVTIPYGAGGSYSVLIMLEPAVEERDEGVAIIVRYAVRLTINVDRPGLRSELQILDTDLVADEQGRPILRVHLKNPSPFRFPLSGEATLRDENRRLIERVTLKTISAIENGHDSFPIYPETELLLFSPITEPLHKGNFFLQNFISYDTNKQLIKGKEIVVEDGQFIAFEQNSISIKSEKLESIVTLGAAATHILQIENRKSTDFDIKIGWEDIEANYPHSIFENLEVEFLGEPEFELGSRRTGRGVVLVRVPRDAALGGYYGNINVYVFSKEGEYLETHTKPLSVLVGKNWQRSVEIRSLAVEKMEEEHLFSISLLNNGEVHLSPTAAIQLRDENNEIVYVINLEMAEEEKSILPGMTGFLTATSLDGNIPVGTYTATVLVFEGQERVGIAEFPLDVE